MQSDAAVYQPIEDYGIVGNMHTVALVGKNGSIDWLCLPRFDSPSVFGALLDAGRGGAFRIAPADAKANSKQLYWPETNVLLTRFLAPHAIGEVIDFMPVGMGAGEPGHQWLVRRVHADRGTMTFRLGCRPAFDYARQPHGTEAHDGRVRFVSPELALELCSDVPLTVEFEVSGDHIGHFTRGARDRCRH